MSIEPIPEETEVSSDEYITGDAEIRNNLLVYGEDVLLTKIPNFADGCKNIVRRILWFNRGADALRPMNKMVGDLQDVHPSGDSSISEAILRLGQACNQGYVLIEISGKAGEYYDIDAAAATRYLDTRLSDFAADVFFKNVNTDAFTMIPTKNANTLEPKYMVPKIPMALVMGNLTVGMGFKSQIPMIDFTQICDLVCCYANYYKSGNIGMPSAKITAPYLIPGFPIRNIILNRKQLLKEYANGNYTAPIELEGWVDLTGNTITLRTMPYGNNFGRIVNKFRSILKDPKNCYKGIVESANNYSSDEAEFTITLRNGVNPFEALEVLRPVLKLRSTFHPLYNYVRNGRIVNLAPPVLTYLWYTERENNIIAGLNHKLAKLNANLMRIQAVLQVIDYRQEAIDIITNSEDNASTVEALYHHFQKVKLTRRQADIISKQSLYVFNKSSKAKHLEDREQTNQDINKALHEFSLTHDTIFNDAAYLKKKYPSVNQTVYSDDYIGHVQFGDWGLINFFNYDEMKRLLATKGWPSKFTKTVQLYSRSRPYKQIVRNGRVQGIDYMTKEICCERMLCLPAPSNKYMTLVVYDSGQTAIIRRQVLADVDKINLFTITPHFYALHKDGGITEENYQNFSIRESISTGAKTDIIYAFPDTTKDVVVFHMNTADPNNLRLSRILYNKEPHSLKVLPCGEMYILGVYPIGQNEIVLNIPQNCVKNFKITHLFLTGLSALFTDDRKDYCIINVTRNKGIGKAKLVPDDVVNTLFRLDLGA